MRCNHTPLPHRFPHLHFNPRTRTGCDQPQKLWLVVAPISTHAPAQGATAKSSWPLHKSKFQPPPPHRAQQQTCIKANICFPLYYIFCTDPCQSSRNFFSRPSFFPYFVSADLPENPCGLAIRTVLNADPFSPFSPKGHCLQGLALAGEAQRRRWPSVWGDKKPPRRCPARRGGHKKRLFSYLTSVTSKWG